jgi:aminoglycoside 6'-N-acetyltransferase
VYRDRASTNIDKAGFKKVLDQKYAKEVWMLKALSLRNDPLQTIQTIIKERYPDAKAVFWAGSVSMNQGTIASDLDLVIVFESLSHAYREACNWSREWAKCKRLLVKVMKR